MPWLSQFFINWTYVLPGLALVSLPIIIHLINRMRYRRVRWAAMEFLLASQQKNRRKLLIEQLLLLMLRVLAVVALVALIARPFFDPRQLLILQGEKTHHLVLLDDSGSQQDHWDQTSGTQEGRGDKMSGFQAGLEVVRKIAEQGARQPGTQNLTLLLLSNPDQPIITETSLDPAFRSELERRIENLRCTHRSLDIVTGLQAAAQYLKNPAAGKNLHIISDFRSRDWTRDSTLATVIKELAAADVTVNVIKTVPERHVNLAVTELTGNVHVAAVNVPSRLKAGIKNLSDTKAEGLRLSVLQDGKKLPLSIVIDGLEPNEETFREFDVVFPTPGKHEVRIELPPDALMSDNTRYLAVDITEANPVLIIAGNVASDEAQFLADALAPAAGITGFAPLIESVDFLRRQPLGKYQCIYLLDVPEIPADGLRVLEEYVNAGGGLTWFVGPQVRTAFYDAQLYRGGTGLFPVPLSTMSDLAVDETNPAPDFNFGNHPVFAAFQGRENPYVATVKVNQYFSVPQGWKPDPRVTVIAQLRNQAPIMFEHAFGAGRVITSLTTCGDGWNDWPKNPSYVLFQLELEKYIARNDRTLERRIVGEPIQISLDPSAYRSQVEIHLPGLEIPTRLTVSPRKPDAPKPATDATAPPAGGTATPPGPAPAATPETPAATQVRLEETFRDTGTPGVYSISRFRQDDTVDQQLIAYNVPVSEGELALATNDAIRSRFGSTVRLKIEEFGEFDWIQGTQIGQEIRDLMLLILLFILICEQFMAMRLSFHPSTAGAPA